MNIFIFHAQIQRMIRESKNEIERNTLESVLQLVLSMTKIPSQTRQPKQKSFEYERHSKLSADSILPHIKMTVLDQESVRGKNREFIDRHKLSLDEIIILNGINVPVTSLRLNTFKVHGKRCVNCGIEGEFFAIERQIRKTFNADGSFVISAHSDWHLNFYALLQEEEVMMTSDHIQPKSKGGADSMENRQTMCAPCNMRKGDSWK